MSLVATHVVEALAELEDFLGSEAISLAEGSQLNAGHSGGPTRPAGPTAAGHVSITDGQRIWVDLVLSNRCTS